MKPQSVRALIWLSIILLVLGGMVMSPLASLLLAALVFLCALPVIFFGSLLPRLVGAALLLGSIGLAGMHYTDASLQMKEYKQQAKQPASSSGTPSRQHK
jgi:hypothetical protein